MRVMMGFALLLLLVSVCFVAPQSAQQDDATRKLWDTAFVGGPKQKTPARRRSNARYRIATPLVPVDNVAPDTVVGVTIWRLRPANPSDSGERLVVHDDSATTQWLPERISANTRLKPGDRVRISVEAARSGYLYVIDREQFADGSLGDPYLIFPTTRTLSGDNQVTVGRLTEIPAQDDSPPFFTIRRSRPDQVAEVLSVLVTPTPLEDLTITEKAQRLSLEQVAKWEKAWSSGVGRMEMATVGQTWTKEEKDANTRALTSSAPAPQLLFYRPMMKPSESMMVKLQLWYRK
jgi:Domain of unknown function (DUF4384)